MPSTLSSLLSFLICPTYHHARRKNVSRLYSCSCQANEWEEVEKNEEDERANTMPYHIMPLPLLLHFPFAWIKTTRANATFFISLHTLFSLFDLKNLKHNDSLLCLSYARTAKKKNSWTFTAYINQNGKCKITKHLMFYEIFFCWKKVPLMIYHSSA